MVSNYSRDMGNFKMEVTMLRDWQECWYEIGLKSVSNMLNPLMYNINELRDQIGKISASGDQLKFFDYIYPSMSKRLSDLEDECKRLSRSLDKINNFLSNHFENQQKSIIEKEKVMPLKKSASKKAFKENVKKEIESGKKPKQALAIAYSVKRKAKSNGKNDMNKDK